jgi:hypothetical protein
VKTKNRQYETILFTIGTNYLIHATKLLKAINFSQLGEALFDISNVVKNS